MMFVNEAAYSATFKAAVLWEIVNVPSDVGLTVNVFVIGTSSTLVSMYLPYDVSL